MTMTALVMGAILVQFLFLGRNYLTSDYTKNRVDQLRTRLEEMEKEGLNETALLHEKDRCQTLIDRFERRNYAAVFIFDNQAALYLSSRDGNHWGRTVYPAIQHMFETGKIYDYADRMFRIRGTLGIPTRLVGTYDTILPDTTQKTGGSVFYVMAVTKEVYTAGVYRMLLIYMLTVLAVVLVLCMFFSYLFVNQISRPILRIRHVAERMTNLDFSESCAENTNDELGDLARRMNYLSETLKKTIGQLEAANSRLRSDLDAQKELDRMRKNFIAAASHEFKTPLTLLRGYLEMMEEDCLTNEQQSEAVSTMIAEIDQMNEMVMKLLSFSRLTMDGFQMEKKALDLTGLIREQTERFQNPAHSDGLVLMARLPEQPVFVEGDRFYLSQLLSNLLSNALRYARRGGQVCISLKSEGDRCTVTVFNEGDPIPEKEIARLGTPFYRVDSSRTRKSGGSGLGLAICREILEKLGGKLICRNREGGVEFAFNLPICKKRRE
jgi:signal transduction histidine kinase